MMEDYLITPISRNSTPIPIDEIIKFTDNPRTVKFDDINDPIIVLDIDGTFYYCNKWNTTYTSNLLRPGTINFINYITNNLKFKLIIWTASVLYHAFNIINLLIDNGIQPEQIHYVIYRGDSWMNNIAYFSKNIKLLNYDINKIVIIDDMINCVADNPNNALIIPTFQLYKNLKDVTLFYISAILQLWKFYNKYSNIFRPINTIFSLIDSSVIEIKYQNFCFVKNRYSVDLLDNLPIILR